MVLVSRIDRLPIRSEEDASGLNGVWSFYGAVFEAGAAAVALRLVDLKGDCTF